MKRAFKTEILLTEEQALKIRKTIGVCRYVYNLFLSKNIENYKNSGSFIGGMDFSKWLNNIHTIEKDQWIKEVSSKAVKQAIMTADKAYKNFFKGQAKFPRFKKKKNQDVKAYFPKNNRTDWTIERHRIKIPTLGWIRLKEYGYIPKNAKVSSGTVSLKAGRYYVSVLCEVSGGNESNINTQDGIGLDLGLKDFAIASDGQTFKNINKTVKVKKLEKSLKRQQRVLNKKLESKKKRGENGSKNIRKQILKVQKLHSRLASKRQEYVRNVAITLVKTKPKYIVIEDLNVKGMMKNRHLADSVSKQNFYSFTHFLLNKCNQYGIELRKVDRWYPSSKLCSTCGYKKTRLSLRERVFKCESCDTELDRDFNASLNLKYAAEYTIITSR